MVHSFKIVALFTFLSLAVGMAKEQTYQNEIAYLLTSIEKTTCMYIRNGTSYTGKEAVSHIQKKYDYFKEDIQSAEDFIRLSASKSTMTGSPYFIHCAGKPKIKSALWLQQLLEIYRNK